MRLRMQPEGFSVDGTPIDAGASMKNFRPDGEKGSTETHASTTDLDPCLYSNGLVVYVKLTPVTVNGTVAKTGKVCKVE